MEKNINITNTKENILEMDIEIEGINASDKKCFFVIKTKEVDFSFKCNNTSGNKWVVTIPKMPQIENTMYDFYIYMVVDGYYFQPYDGTINVVKSNEIYVKDISNKTFKPTDKTNKEESTPPKDKIKKEVHTEPKVKETKKEIKETTNFNKSITALTNKILRENSPKTKEELLKEQKIKDILKESNIKLDPINNHKVKMSKGSITEL